jgi:glucan phosphoethanolaminetransferase (alkaline phosphatase superfamily)
VPKESKKVHLPGVKRITTAIQKTMEPLTKIAGKISLFCQIYVPVIFPIFLVTYLLLLLLETLFEGSVSSYLNLNYMLIAVIFFGVIAILVSNNKNEAPKQGHSLTKTIITVCAGLGGAFIIWYKTKEMGWLSYIISIVSGAIIVLISILNWGDDKEDIDDKQDNQDN